MSAPCSGTTLLADPADPLTPPAAHGTAAGLLRHGLMGDGLVNAGLAGAGLVSAGSVDDGLAGAGLLSDGLMGGGSGGWVAGP